jgi:hypothetical protein
LGIFLLHLCSIQQDLIGPKILRSGAWNVILNGSEGETYVPFSIPPKCPAKRKLECTITEFVDVGRDENHEVQLPGETQHMQGQEPSMESSAAP